MSPLPRETLWDRDHLSDTAVILLADAELALLTPSVKEHADACPACQARVAEEASLSLRVDAVFEAPETTTAPISAPVSARSRGRARRALGWGLAALALGALPGLSALPGALTGAVHQIVRGAPALLHSARMVTRVLAAQRGWLAVASSLAACVLCLAALALAQRARRLPEGGSDEA